VPHDYMVITRSTNKLIREGNIQASLQA